MTKHLDVAQCLTIIEGTNTALKSYMDHFDFMEAAISRVLELEGSLKGKGGEALLRNYQELQLPAIRAARAFIINMMDKGEKLRSLILSFEPSENGMVSEDFYRNQVTRGYDRFEQFMEQNKAEVDAIAASVSHIIDLGKLDIRHVQDRVDDARKHANDTVEGLYELDHEGMRLMRELQMDMAELKAILKKVTEWTVSGGALLNGVDLNDVRSHFADKTLHTKAPEVSVKLSTPNPLVQYANNFPLRFKYDTMHSIMKVFDLSRHQKWLSDRIKSLPLTSLFNVARASTGRTSNTVSSAPYHTSLYNVTRMSRGKTSNAVSSAPYHTIPKREPSVWTYANAHYSGDKVTVERAAEAIREIQERERENQEPYNPMRTVSTVLDFLPFVGNAKAGQEASTGVDLITEEELDEWDRGIAAASVVLGGVGRIAGRTLKNIIKGSDDIPDALRIGDSQATGGTINNLDKGIGNPKTRLPRTNGKWEGEPGNGKWYSDKPEVKNITNGEGVEFINGRPNFTPWSKGSIKFKVGMLDGSKNDFNLVYEKIMQLKGFKSQNQAKLWLKEKGLTPHHKNSTEIELIPTDLHANIPHIGSASDLRGGN